MQTLFDSDGIELTREIPSERWLMDTRQLFTRLEREAEILAKYIVDEKDTDRAERLRSEWSRLVGCLTEFAVSMSDMLSRLSK